MLLRQNDGCRQHLSDRFNDLFCFRANILVFFLVCLLFASQSIGKALCKSVLLVNGTYYIIFSRRL